ncbi:MAG: thiamine-phosphate kinase [Parachlamydia sp.]|jgi:thiamine-monophosphate kinase|nr:thiamine-phosphate kinase [Parachlamydia sp.]
MDQTPLYFASTKDAGRYTGKGIHFKKTTITPEELGYKSLAVSLSDIAAMGGKPLYLFLSLALPKEIEIDWLDRFFKGLADLAASENTLILGGDTSRTSDTIVIDSIVVGSAPTAWIKKRSFAKPGDFICCTGYLGDAGAGLEILEKHLLHPSNRPLIEAHVHPRPHLLEGQWLAAQEGVHAMMDLSDGLDADLEKIMELSHCGACIQMDALPLSPSLESCSNYFHWNAQEVAATSGEDYCLLVTVDPSNYEAINQAYRKMFERPLFKMGHITSHPTLKYVKNGQPFRFAKKGFDHFQI